MGEIKGRARRPECMAGQYFDCFHKLAGWDRVVQDKIVCNGPCYLLNLTVCSDGGGVGTASVYDGNSVAGRRMIDLAVLNNQWQDCPCRHPVYFSNGLFVDVGANILSIFVHYLPIQE